MARTRWMFGFQRRLVRRWEWLMLIPNDGRLPHTSHTAAMTLRVPLAVDSDKPQEVSILGMVSLERARSQRSCGRLVTAFRDGLRAHQEVINRLNVYPVPDGDTGTNMALTLESVTDELAGLEAPDMAAICRAIGHGSLMGARGNSGVILSQLLRGLADGAQLPPARAGGRRAGRGPDHRRPAAHEAVMRPVEGTILTVARGAAEGAAGGGRGGEVAGRRARGRPGRGRRRPGPHPVAPPVLEAGRGGRRRRRRLRAAARRLALRRSTDARCPTRPDCPDRVRAAQPEAPGTASSAGDAAATDDLSGLRYEVMYLLEAPDDTIPPFKEVWAGIGDSIVVVGGDGIWNCHIHTDDIGAAIEASLDAGRPQRSGSPTCWSRSRRSAGYAKRPAQPGGAGPETCRGRCTTAVVAVATGDGHRGGIFRSLGRPGTSSPAASR